MGCSCESSLARIHDGLRAADDVVSKALGVSELAQSAKVEVRDRDLLYGTWRKLSTEAAKAAEKAVTGGNGELTEADASKASDVVDKVMARWAGQVTSGHLKDIEKIYELAHVAAAAKGYGFTSDRMDVSVPVMKADNPEMVSRIRVSLNEADQDMLKALYKRQTIWIGGHYEENVSLSVRESVRQTLLVGGEARGGGRVEVGKALRERVERTLSEVKVPNGFNGPVDKYFEGLAAHASTVARTHSQLNVFHRLGFTMYEVVNPRDTRTCPICGELDGKQFQMDDGTKLSARLGRAKTPEQVKRIQPYVTRGQVLSLIGEGSGIGATRKLAARGNSMPPFHYECRCSVDVVAGAESPAPFELAPNGEIVVPQERIAPRTSVAIPESAPDWKELQPGTEKIADLWDGATKSGDYSKFRKDFEKYLEKHWGISRFTRNLRTRDFINVIQRKSKALMPGVGGTYSMTHGLITLREDYAKALGPNLRALGRWGNPQGDAVKTIVHELVHGADRISTRAYTGAGEVLCEATTELTARKIGLDMAGNTVYTARSLGGAYQEYILDIRDSVFSVTEWDLERVDKEITRAAWLMHTKAVAKHATTQKQVVSNFIDMLPSSSELTAKQRESLTTKLMSLRPKKKGK